MRLDLVDLRLFLTVVEQGSLTKGAHAANLALASVSERISGMESMLCVPLLERTRRGVSATAAGNALIRHARLLLAQAELMRGELRTYASGVKGRIRLLSNTAALAVFLPLQLRDFLVEYPDLSVDISEHTSAGIVLALIEGRADLGIVADTTDLTSVQTRLVAVDQLVVVANNAHRISKQQSVIFADILDDAFVGLSDAALEIHLGEHAARLGRQIDYRVQLRSVANVGLLVDAGVGVTILSEVAAAELRHLDVAIVPLAEAWASRHLYLCARDFATLTPHADLLAQRIIKSSEP